MAIKKVLVTRKIPKNGIDLLRDAGFEVTLWEKEFPMEPEELITSAKEHHALLCSSWDKLDARFFREASHLDIVSQFAVGYDNISISEATKHHIAVANAPGVLSNATADIAFGLMIAVSRNMFQNHKIIGSDKWKHNDLTANLGIELNDKTVGIFGLGQIGHLMAKKCVGAYNMKVIYHNRSRNVQAERELGAKYVEFGELLSQSDVISVHSNLSPETANTFDKRAFGQMRSQAIFINTARGPIHNEKDLIVALEDGTIWGAGLDVTDPEPMNADNPLLGMPNVCVLPHIGSATVTARLGMSEVAARNILQFYGEMPVENLLNREVMS
ncbi:MAG: D-glycerate dehydrogenase [Sediminicola sp.]